MAVNEYYQEYESQGFFFDRSLLTTYCLSLHAKPFVILSGISGTGKTKIAQLFSPFATQAAIAASPKKPVTTPTNLPGKWILMTIGGGVISGDGRANFQYKDIDALLSLEEVAALAPKIKELKEAGREDNICEPFPIIIEGVNKEEVNATVYLQRASSPLLRVRFKSKRGESTWDSTEYFRKNHKLGDVLKLEKIGDKRLRVASVNDKSVIDQSAELEQEEYKNVKNSCFISVRSDWTDSSALFGYYNLIEQKYHVTPLVAFLLSATNNPNLPFFLILDEMNLAKVEHYFSDFLSCLESRHIKDGKLVQEPIRLNAGSGWLETDDDYFDVIPPEIAIPQNLYVTGTVNIDESTYMFSSKVLDRANVIELNKVDLDGYGATKAAPVGDDYVLDSFPLFTSTNLATKKDYVGLVDEGKDFFKRIHAILEKYHLHFGYRVMNEVSLYINNALKYCHPSERRLDLAKDYQLVQKILPKFSGPQGKLDLPLREILQFLVGNTESIERFDFEVIQNINPENTRYPLSVSKLRRMYITLVINGFANFIE
jgi:hypothetical protein